MMNKALNGINCTGSGQWMIMGSMLLFWIIAIIGIIWIIKYVQAHHIKPHFKEDNSLAILNERLAQGEIEVEAYEKLKDVLCRR